MIEKWFDFHQETFQEVFPNYKKASYKSICWSQTFKIPFNQLKVTQKPVLSWEHLPCRPQKVRSNENAEAEARTVIGQGFLRLSGSTNQRPKTKNDDALWKKKFPRFYQVVIYNNYLKLWNTK